MTNPTNTNNNTTNASHNYLAWDASTRMAAELCVADNKSLFSKLMNVPDYEFTNFISDIFIGCQPMSSLETKELVRSVHANSRIRVMYQASLLAERHGFVVNNTTAEYGGSLPRNALNTLFGNSSDDNEYYEGLSVGNEDELLGDTNLEEGFSVIDLEEQNVDDMIASNTF